MEEYRPSRAGTGAEEAGPEGASAVSVQVEAGSQKPLSNQAVTEHTASLWKYLPVSKEEPEPAPEYLRVYREFPGGRVIAARVRGKKHKHEGGGCDDWFETGWVQDLFFAAVSDGAGSRRFSRIGARESCRAAAGYLRRELESLWTPELAKSAGRDDPRRMTACGTLAGAVQRAVLAARNAVESAFYTRVQDPAYESLLGRPLELGDFSATLLVTAVVPAGEGEGERLTVSCQVGDGAIALLDSRAPFAGSLRLMGTADSGAFSGETEFLTSPKMAALEALQSRTRLSLGRSDLLFMMTDGVSDDYFPPAAELRRLYFDLAANGILEAPRSGGRVREELLQKLPRPLAYPWVNDQTVEVPLHYTRRMMEAAGLTLEDLWDDGSVLAAARDALDGQLSLPDPAARLERWLDNYVERGSFDDRTLVIAEF